MDSPRRPWWQQATALVSLSAGGAMTGFAFVPGTADAVASPAGLPVTLTALEHAARPAPSDDSAVRSAIVSVTNYYVRLAQSKTPAEMEALIWQRDSTDGADHGESCAAFASMTLALAAQMVGRQSWVTGGSSYPWPLQDWADVRVDPNPASPGITSILQDAQAHQRWRPLGDGYQPLPGDWVLFDGHVEVVTKYAGGVLSTVGGDSLPDFSVNAHEYPGPLAAQGVAGFVSNGNLPVAGGSAAVSSPSSAPVGAGTVAAAQSGTATAPAPGRTGTASSSGSSTPPATQQADEQPAGALAAVPGTVATASVSAAAVQAEQAVIPGVPEPGPTASGRAASVARAPFHRAASPVAAHRAARSGTGNNQPARQASPGPVAVAGTVADVSSQAAAYQPASFNASPDVVIPGMPEAAATGGAGYSPATTSTRQQPAPAAAAGSQQPAAAAAAGRGTPAQQAFIAQVAPGAIAAQRTYGVPASVTIAQAIDESGWGQSTLAVQANNLFGIKGTGPAGSDSFPTQEFENGQWVTTTAQFRAYHDVAQSIEDHGQLLATGGYYTAAMAERQTPDSFAQALTGVYATNPDYGSNLISLMQRFDLYRFGASTQPAAAARAPRGTATPPATASASPAATAPATPSATAPATPPVTPSPPRARAAAAGATVSPPAARPGPVAPSTTVTTPAVAPSTTVSPPAAKASANAAAPGLATPNATGSPHAMATAPAAQAPAQAAGKAATPPSSPVPHPFATVQPAATSPDQAAIPGIPSGPAPTSTHTTSQLRSSAAASRPRSSADTEVVAELTAVFRRETPARKPLPERVPGSRPAHRKPPTEASPAKRAPVDRSAQKKPGKRKGSAAKARKTAPRYQPQMPTPVKNAFLGSARKPLARAEFLYRDVAGTCGISWKLLAACDWMQCEAHPRYSPVQGEKLGTVNPDGTVFRTKSGALTQCARELVAVADTVYQIDLTVPVELSVLELARVFAAFRWGGLLKLHDTSAMEFPYSVQGLTEQHSGMRWPKIADPNAPDRPGARFRRPFGAVPVVLSLDYPATV